MRDPALDRVTRWIAEHGPTLLPVARAFSQDTDEAEDILHDAWMIALKKSGTVPATVPVRAWLHRVVINVGRAWVRKRARRTNLLRSWFSGRPRPRGISGSSVEGEQLRLLLWREIAELPALQKEVVLLRVVEEMSTKEAARVIGRAEGTVKASLHRGLATLRKRLDARGLPWTQLVEVR